ncbi:MAG: hypothetical protein CL942_04315 [Desulfovibrio sp.]|nr:hypothetical protein [Desulfovibrio sp.]|tara:strand:- start:53780 stop:54202 length:423 start_codon:yes stop_codon:yes gene_type:complete
MKLSARSRYATRLLLALADNTSDAPVRTVTLSEITGVTVQFIEQIIRPLKKAGLVTSVRGAAGGYYLARPPERITLHDIVRHTEGSINIAECLDCEESCNKIDSCQTRSAWERVSRAIEQELESMTLAELMEPSESSEAN